MRIKALLMFAALAAGTAATALPAAAQTYSQNCQRAKANNQVGGAILGGILGGVLGSNVAASGHRHDGTAVGAVLGGMVGAGVGGKSTNCDPTPPRDAYGYGPGSDYNRNPNYGGDGYGYGSAPAGTYPYDPGYSSSRYGNDPYYDDRVRGNLPQGRSGPDLYPSGSRAYNDSSDYAGSDCSEATQVTRLPDGSEVHRPIEVCRDAYYGDWRVKD